MIKSESLQSILIVLAALLLWAAIWIFLSWLFAKISGWMILAKNYETSKRISGEWLYFQSAITRSFFGFRGSLNICVSPHGLYISTYFPFKFFQPPLFIPWGDISGLETRGGFWGSVELRFEKAPTIPFKINTRLADRFEKTLNGQWRYGRLQKIKNQIS